jgi:hypothetical protein
VAVRVLGIAEERVGEDLLQRRLIE